MAPNVAPAALVLRVTLSTELAGLTTGSSGWTEERTELERRLREFKGAKE